jgi:tetratricopeptide (TPR) repeat protein
MVGEALTHSAVSGARVPDVISLVVTILLALLTTGYAAAQDVMILGRQAEEAGNAREAVRHYTAALQVLSAGSVEERQLREKIIDLARTLDPKPAISDEAERRFVRSGVIAKAARGREDYVKAAEELREALKLAPWWSDAYVNYALISEQLGEPAEAMRSLKLYLRLNPNAADGRQIRHKIYALEAALELQRTSRPEGGQFRTEGGSILDLKIQGKRLVVKYLETSEVAARHHGYSVGDIYIEGDVEDKRFVGKWFWKVSLPFTRCFGSKKSDPVIGEFSADGRKVQLTRTESVYVDPKTCQKIGEIHKSDVWERVN